MAVNGFPTDNDNTTLTHELENIYIENIKSNIIEIPTLSSDIKKHVDDISNTNEPSLQIENTYTPNNIISDVVGSVLQTQNVNTIDDMGFYKGNLISNIQLIIGKAVSYGFQFRKELSVKRNKINKEVIDWVEINKHLCSGIINFLREHIPVDLYLKWPNDIIYNDRKLGGMIMNLVAKDEVHYLVLGLGINLVQPTKLPQAIGLYEILDPNNIDPKPFTLTLIDFLNNLMGQKPKAKVDQTYSKFLWRLGEMVDVQPYPTNSDKIEQSTVRKFIGVDENGRALFAEHRAYVAFHSGMASILLPPRKK